MLRNRISTFLSIGVFALVTLVLLPVAHAADGGPGIGRVVFRPDEIGKPFYRFTMPNRDPDRNWALRKAKMFQGYLIVTRLANTSRIYDISNPRQPRQVGTAGLNSAHTYPTWGPYMLAEGKIVDFTDPIRPRQVGRVTPGLTLWSHLQWPYVYTANTYGSDPNGRSQFRISDVRDVTAPATIAELDLRPELGFRTGSVHVIGNLMLVSEGGSGAGIASYDLSDPLRPRLLDTRGSNRMYFSQVYGHYLVTTGPVNAGHLAIYDFSDPSNLRQVYNALSQQDDPTRQVRRAMADYAHFQDGFLYGAQMFEDNNQQERWVKFDLTNMTAARYGTQRNSMGERVARRYAVPLGNLLWIGDVGTGDVKSALFAVDEQPDSLGPVVEYINPPDGATRQVVGSRIGICFDEDIDNRTLTAANIQVRAVGGDAVDGIYSHQMGIVNFTPRAPLQADTTYEIIVRRGGVKDWSGNTAPQEFRSRFSTGTRLEDRPDVGITVTSSGPAATGVEVQFTAALTNAPAGTRISWRLGDGRNLAPGTARRIQHRYAKAGRYAVLARAHIPGQSQPVATATVLHIAHNPVQPGRAAASGPVQLSRDASQVWCVNPDAASISRIDAADMRLLSETRLGGNPVACAVDGQGKVWITDAKDARVFVVSAQGQQEAVLRLPYGSEPRGIVVHPSGNTAYVALSGKGAVAELDTRQRRLVRMVTAVPTARALALSHDGERLYVSRFLSTDAFAEVIELSTSPLAIRRQLVLPLDTTTPDAENSARGLPNYLRGLNISPDGRRLAVVAKKDNILRGGMRDGEPLNFQNTVRAMVAHIDLVDGRELLDERVDFNNMEGAAAVQFSPLGDLLMTAMQGNDLVLVRDANDPHPGLTESGSEGAAPDALLIDPVRRRLWVKNFLGRSLTVFDISDLLVGRSLQLRPIRNISTVAEEPLHADVLAGKRLFYRAADTRMSTDNYLSCASCHLNGGHDGRVWDFSDRGEGLRNTTDLRGRRGTGHGAVHWTANFDEIHDFEHDMRGPFGGTGFMSDAAFAQGSRAEPLGDAKARSSEALDQLAAYVSSLHAVPASPHRRADGALTGSAHQGRNLFKALDCARCHGGATFTDSMAGQLHDVGTMTNRSGQRLGEGLTGLDTPSLLGVHATAPYLHDGSATSLTAVFAQNRVGDGHAAVQNLSETQRRQLYDYLLQIDDSSQPLASSARQQWRAAYSDGFVRDGQFDEQNFGAQSSLEIKDLSASADYRRRAFMRFSLQALQAQQLERVYLHLHVQSVQDGGTALGLRCEQVSADWQEYQLNWRNQPPVGDVLGSLAVTTAGQALRLDITAAVRAALQSGQGWLHIRCSESQQANRLIRLASREAGTRGPRLEIIQRDVISGPPAAPTGLRVLTD